ncbi:MAG: ComF family protein [Candidatus Adiutrix sp.]
MLIRALNYQTLKGALKNWGASLADVFWPPVCATCPKFLPLSDDGFSPQTYFCPECLSTIEFLKNTCPLCARPLSGDRPHLCGHCLKTPPLYDSVLSACLHRGAAAKSINLLKYYGQLRQLKPLAALVHTALGFSNLSFDLMAPVPLSPKRETQRGFNQSFELSQAIFGYSPNMSVIKREKDGGFHQASLTAKERQRAIVGHFKVLAPALVEGQRILLFDDVMTTGATASEITKVLKEAGALEVHILTVCRTPLHFW